MDHVSKVNKGDMGLTQKEYVGDERIKGMQIINLVREFELQRMKESK